MLSESLSCAAADGTHIAYVARGSGSPIAIVTGWSTTVEQQLASEYSRPFIDHIAAGHRVLMYDRRGVGASQRDVADLTLPAQVDDLMSVLNALDIEQCDLLGDNDGCYVAIAFAAGHSQRVRRIALWAPLVAGQDARPQGMREFARLIRTDWAAAKAQWASYRAPNGTDEERQAIADGFDAMISPEIAAAYLEWEADENVAALLPGITARTLVVNTRRSGPRSMGVAQLVPGARFEPLDADPGTGRADSTAVADAILRFFDEAV